jgi:hypothetical protein
MRSSSQQCLLDTFFGRLCGDGSLVRAVSDRAFAQARARLHAPALSWLNDRLWLVPMLRAWCRAGRACAWWPPTPRC